MWDAERKERDSKTAFIVPKSSSYICYTCGRDSHSRVGLFSHNRKYAVAK